MPDLALLVTPARGLAVLALSLAPCVWVGCASAEPKAEATTDDEGALDESDLERSSDALSAEGCNTHNPWRRDNTAGAVLGTWASQTSSSYNGQPVQNGESVVFRSDGTYSLEIAWFSSNPPTQNNASYDNFNYTVRKGLIKLSRPIAETGQQRVLATMTMQRNCTSGAQRIVSIPHDGPKAAQYLTLQ
jgi:hypothetical protein